MIKHFLALVLYKLGDWVSYLMNLPGFSFLFPVYSKLMIWSYDLDTEKRIWKDVGR